jgi:hypothetical protein
MTVIATVQENSKRCFGLGRFRRIGPPDAIPLLAAGVDDISRRNIGTPRERHCKQEKPRKGQRGRE